MVAERLRRLLPGLWAGLLFCIAAVATPAPFATLSRVDAGRVVGRIFAVEAPLSLVLAVLLFLLERRVAHRAAAEGRGSVFSTEMLLLLGALACTVFGYYGLQPWFAQARAGQGPLSFAALHMLSLGLFAVKGLLVLALAWRASRAGLRD